MGVPSAALALNCLGCVRRLDGGVGAVRLTV